MKATLACLALLCFCAVLAPSRIEVKAEPESAGDAFKKRPFNEHLDWDEARAVARKALKGDAKARESIEQGGLSYVPLLVSLRTDPATAWSRELLAAHTDWIDDMQRWERALLRPDARLTAKLYTELKDRFRDPGPQLARAIIHAWRLGDAEAQTALAALEPRSKWVLAARGYIADGIPEKEAIDLMLPVYNEVTKAEERELFVQRAFLDPENFELKENSKRGISLEVSAFLREDGLPQLRQVPVEWLPTGYSERIAALAAQTHDKEYITGLLDKIVAYCGTDYARQRRYVAFAEVALEEFNNKPLEAEKCETYALDSNGPMVGVWSRRVAAGDMPVEIALAAITAFNRFPDLEASQRWCLKQCLGYPDRLTGLLAIRGVLALRDDRFDGYRSVALELNADPAWANRATGFRKALSACGNEKLAVLAKYMAGEAKIPDASFESLGLSVEQRAALLQPFVHPDENAAHGGTVGVYWLNLSHFLEGRGAVVSSLQCLAAAIVEAARVSGRNFANANTLDWKRFLERHLDSAHLAPLMERLTKQFPKLTTILAAEEALSTNTQAKPEDRIYYLAREAEEANEEIPDEQLKMMFADLSRCGAGVGLQMAAVTYWRRNTKYYWLLNERRAQLASPTDISVCANMGGVADIFGTHSLGTWETKTQCALQCAMLMPARALTLMAASNVLAAMGTPAVAAGAMFEYAASRTQERFFGVNRLADLGMLFNSAVQVWHWLNAQASAWCGEIPEGWKAVFTNAILSTRWINRTWDWFGVLADISLRPEFVRRCATYIMTRYSDQDVNNLLNMSLGFGRVYPQSALRLIQRSDEIGVSDYGRFVGSQTYIRAKAQLGEVDEAFKRYKEMRPTDIGYPPYLDRFLLAGLTEGNQYARLDDALELLSGFELELEKPTLAFLNRRALMAAGHYQKVSEAKAPVSVQKDVALNGAHEYSALFHEARDLLDKGNFVALGEHAQPYIDRKVQASIGVYLDAYLLAALADKELDLDSTKLNKEGKLQWLSTNSLDRFGQADTLLDAQALEVLVGRRTWNELQLPNARLFWHGSRYPERPSIDNGNGFLTAAECEARDPFVRGVLAYLSNRKQKAREYFEACVAKDQRCSHEYHVAQWLLDKRLKPEEKK